VWKFRWGSLLQKVVCHLKRRGFTLGKGIWQRNEGLQQMNEMFEQLKEAFKAASPGV
jgi:hypothetical protein